MKIESRISEDSRF